MTTRRVTLSEAGKLRGADTMITELLQDEYKAMRDNRTFSGSLSLLVNRMINRHNSDNTTKNGKSYLFAR